MSKVTLDPPDPPDPQDRREPQKSAKSAESAESPRRHATKAPPRAAAARAKAAPAVRQRAPEPPREPPPAEAPPFERGAQVRVTSGPFEGKTGVVEKLVGRRSARVLLGLLPVQIDLDDLAPSALNASARSRPRLTSSHRKPVPARS